MHGTTTTLFNCASCNAVYHLVKVEAGPETVDREINCRACGAPLPARDGPLILKYFLLRKPSKVRSVAGAPDDSELTASVFQKRTLANDD
jgi:hypothetical protein